jgi:hypothetical protein
VAEVIGGGDGNGVVGGAGVSHRRQRRQHIGNRGVDDQTRRSRSGNASAGCRQQARRIAQVDGDCRRSKGVGNTQAADCCCCSAGDRRRWRRADRNVAATPGNKPSRLRGGKRRRTKIRGKATGIILVICRWKLGSAKKNQTAVPTKRNVCMALSLAWSIRPIHRWVCWDGGCSEMTKHDHVELLKNIAYGTAAVGTGCLALVVSWMAIAAIISPLAGRH